MKSSDGGKNPPAIPGNSKDTRGDFDWLVYRNHNSQYLRCHLELDTFWNAYWKNEKLQSNNLEGRD